MRSAESFPMAAAEAWIAGNAAIPFVAKVASRTCAPTAYPVPDPDGVPPITQVEKPRLSIKYG